VEEVLIANARRFDRIRVNGVNIGGTFTANEDSVQRATGKGDDWLQKAEAEQPFGRLLRPDDCAYLVGHLLSDRVQMMTGSLRDVNQTVVGTWD
jgi:NAD(P)-dependent dehydrogenase (short-subunit alcohol dehydrogenase family)